ncbi:MAG: MurT ligase domain-containing protein [Candidatus Obscuribacterales bacterium]|nr:MurT ligase domain-containing protein [Candidatus Obscuribacterales bacterium]
MSDTLAVIAGKLSAQAIRIMGLGLGSNLPGRVSLKIAPSVLSHLSSQARKGVVAVSGTNGKSTTSGLIASIFGAASQKIVHNRQGANLLTGIAATVVDASNWTGNLDADYCLFEIDEAALPLVAKEVKIANIVVTNLFRDQLDRFGELDTTAKLITSGIAVNSSAAILNADDPNVAQMVPNVERLFYGIKNLATESCGETEGRELIGQANTSELSYCPSCGNEYEYDLLVYGQLGHYRCSCGHRRPEPEVYAEDVKVHATGSTFKLHYNNQSIDVELNLPGTFNVYNALASAALAFKLGLPSDAIKKGLCSYSTLFGRSERVNLDGKQILIQLIKNPAGASQALQAAARDPQGKFLIALNDNYADGRDVSWIWDADFEQLAGCEGPFVVSGTRCNDLAVRLKYAGVASEKITIEPSLDRALDQAKGLCSGEQILWLLPTYTCLLELQKIFKARGTPLAGT